MVGGATRRPLGTPRQRAEWIDFIATFLNLEATSNEVFDGIQSRYNCHANNGDFMVRGRDA